MTKINAIDKMLSVASQMERKDVHQVASLGFKSIVCNRPDREGDNQPDHAELKAEAERLGLEFVYQPVSPTDLSDEDALAFGANLQRLPGPVLAYCRTGNRCSKLWDRFRSLQSASLASSYADIVIVGGGAAGIAVASSIRARNSTASITLVEPAEVHYYQPGWTLVGAGVFRPTDTVRATQTLIPPNVHWLRKSVVEFLPLTNQVVLNDNSLLNYKQLVVCPGLKLNWAGIAGLEDALGEHGVTSNYRFDLAPYTFDLVRKMKAGKAVFTQPAMPIKCAGAPQKAMYLSSDYWRRAGVKSDIDVVFHNAGGVLFGVPEYVPALMEYIGKYNIDLNFASNLVEVDGPKQTAVFKSMVPDSGGTLTEVPFDLLHVVPPQIAPDFVRNSPLADAAGWVDVDQYTLRHKQHSNVFALGDVCNAPNAKTAAAARKQAPVVANNVLQALGLWDGVARYDGYGSCPLTVELGKIVLAEFTYGGKLAPSFPNWLIDGTKPSRLAWILKEKILPPLYWNGMLKGHEWLAKPLMVE
ncbi:MAG TPA: TIGR01244 family sulfur transferase [Limnobacter sp.]|uniref:TIGR01244 family sulfur transferase n=1 Tax=Limnobacter sp. TaxID=2003368 RepID=UPI002E336879|nr:TIGR01244 family sulfur transferase [Limnobacter sp.]HEX5486463.1 TIGR01244 family sulfur transferase [Limnobacter sp.]